jgi:TonB family protein
MRLAFVIVVFCLIAPLAFPQNASIEAELRQRFQDKIFLIQGWYQDKNLIYDSSGTVIGTPRRGSWAASAVKIRSIEVHEDDFVLRGSRGGFAYVPEDKKFEPLFPKKSLDAKITVQTSPATLTPATLDAIEHTIFTVAVNEHRLPDYWHTFMFHDEQDQTAKSSAREEDAAPQIPLKALLQGAQAGHVVPPRILYQKEPDFTEVARRAEYQGRMTLSTVIDTQGHPTQFKILRPLGMGLDDQAVDCVRGWRFAPANRDGQPVAVTVEIEINFRLY